MQPLTFIPLLVVVVASAIAATTDLWKFKVYNALTLPMLAAGLAYHGATGGWAGLGASLLGMLFGFGVLVVFYAFGGVGPGDVKLLAAIGAWFGVPLTFVVFVASALAGGVYALGLMLLTRSLGETVVAVQFLGRRMLAADPTLIPQERVEEEVLRPDRRRRLIPYAAMIGVGVLATVAWAWNAGDVDVRPPFASASDLSDSDLGFEPSALSRILTLSSSPGGGL